MTLRVVLALAALLGSCGYHIAGQADLMPKTVKTIAIPAFENATIRYKLTDRLPQEIAREFNARTRYRMISDVNTADAVLKGTVTSYVSFPTVFDQATGRASAVDLRVNMKVTLTERATGKVLFTRPAFSVTERYEISQSVPQYFEESDAALNRVAKAAAQQLVTAILDNF